jgi:hypothetical protein
VRTQAAKRARKAKDLAVFDTTYLRTQGRPDPLRDRAAATDDFGVPTMAADELVENILNPPLRDRVDVFLSQLQDNTVKGIWRIRKAAAKFFNALHVNGWVR